MRELQNIRGMRRGAMRFGFLSVKCPSLRMIRLNSGEANIRTTSNEKSAISEERLIADETRTDFSDMRQAEESIIDADKWSKDLIEDEKRKLSRLRQEEVKISGLLQQEVKSGQEEVNATQNEMLRALINLYTKILNLQLKKLENGQAQMEVELKVSSAHFVSVVKRELNARWAKLIDGANVLRKDLEDSNRETDRKMWDLIREHGFIKRVFEQMSAGIGNARAEVVRLEKQVEQLTEEISSSSKKYWGTLVAQIFILIISFVIGDFLLQAVCGEKRSVFLDSLRYSENPTFKSLGELSTLRPRLKVLELQKGLVESQKEIFELRLKLLSLKVEHDSYWPIPGVRNVREQLRQQMEVVKANLARLEAEYDLRKDEARNAETSLLPMISVPTSAAVPRVTL